MGAHHGLERAPFEPADKQLRIILIVPNGATDIGPIDEWLVFGVGVCWDRWREKPRDVSVPVGQTGSGKIQPSRDRTLEHIPGRDNVARPKNRAVALRPEICGSGQNHHPATVSEVAPKTLINRGSVKQRIHVVVAGARTDREPIVRRIYIRFRLIQPDVIETVGLNIPISYLLPEPLRCRSEE